MSKAADEPAFPKFEPNYEFGADFPKLEPTGGLTKREYFAGLAMQGMLASDLVQKQMGGVGTETILAGACIAIADALLLELNKAPTDSCGEGE